MGCGSPVETFAKQKQRPRRQSRLASCAMRRNVWVKYNHIINGRSFLPFFPSRTKQKSLSNRESATTILHSSFLILVTGCHLPQPSLSRFGASGGAILSLSLVKEKEWPKKEKVAWASDTAKEGQPFPRGTRKPSVISPTAENSNGERKAIRAVRFYERNSFFKSVAFPGGTRLLFAAEAKKQTETPSASAILH